MDWTPRRDRFRALLAGGECVFPASVFDPLSARIADDLGFELGMFAGSVASMTVLGAPDLIVLTATEFAEQALRINRAARLPLLVDADHGYGNALNVRRTVAELETAGVAALSLEDTRLPAGFGDRGKVGLISIDEGVGKLRAALDAREDARLAIAGRTSAPMLTGIEDTLTRIRAYQDAGVDALFLVGVKTAADLEAIAKVAKLPLILGGAPPELQDRALLAAHGVRVCLQGHQPFAAAVQAVHATFKALREGAAPSSLAVGSGPLLKQLTRESDYEDWLRRFMGGA